MSLKKLLNRILINFLQFFSGHSLPPKQRSRKISRQLLILIKLICIRFSRVLWLQYFQLYILNKFPCFLCFFIQFFFQLEFSCLRLYRWYAYYFKNWFLYLLYFFFFLMLFFILLLNGLSLELFSLL